MAVESITSGFYEGLTLEKLEKHILWELGQVIGTEVSFNRFPQWLIRDKLNDRLNWFVFASQCITKFALVVAKEDYRRYKLPVNCMENGVISVKYFLDSSTYEDIDIVDQAYMDANYEGWLTEDSSTPEYAWMGNMYGNIPMINVHPRPDSDGTVYASGDDVGIAVGDEMPATNSNITGQATNGSSTTLRDTTVDFTTMGLGPGIYVVNVTDNSLAPIQSIAANTLTFASALSGGTANSFSAGDSYEILAGEYGVITQWDDDELYLFGSGIGLISSITVPSGNFYIDYIPYPQQFPSEDNLGQKPEIPKLYHMSLAMGVVSDFLRGFHEKTKEFSRAEYYESIYQKAVISAAGKRAARPFNKKQTRLRPIWRSR